MMFPCVSIHDMERNLGLGLQFVLGIPYSNVAFGFWACPVVTTSVEWFVTAMLLVVYCGYLGHLVIKHRHLLNHLFLLMFQLFFTVIPLPTETLGEIQSPHAAAGSFVIRSAKDIIRNAMARMCRDGTISEMFLWHQSWAPELPNTSLTMTPTSVPGGTLQ